MDKFFPLRSTHGMEQGAGNAPSRGRFGGIDLGGTKIEAQIFDADWHCVEARRWPTPRGYRTLLDQLAVARDWLATSGAGPIGLAHPGIAAPGSGRVSAANLPVHGQVFADDLRDALGVCLPRLNDAQAFALSEARLGAGRGADPVAGLVLGTGVAAGLSVAGTVLAGWRGAAGELGHLPLPAELVSRWDLPILPCGCGASGCFETLASGHGLARLGLHLTGQRRNGADWAGRADVLAVWFDIIVTLVTAICRVWDPQVIVLGGGASAAPEIVAQLSARIQADPLCAGAPPAIRLAEGREASGARGAALHAAALA